MVLPAFRSRQRIQIFTGESTGKTEHRYCFSFSSLTQSTVSFFLHSFVQEIQMHKCRKTSIREPFKCRYVRLKWAVLFYSNCMHEVMESRVPHHRTANQSELSELFYPFPLPLKKSRIQSRLSKSKNRCSFSNTLIRENPPSSSFSREKGSCKIRNFNIIHTIWNEGRL